jgi:hypothetical protein
MTPFKSNQQLNIEKKDREERQNAMNNAADIKRQMAGDPLLELKINQPQQMMIGPGGVGQIGQVGQFGPMQNQIYPSPYVPVPNPYYPLATNGMVPWQYTQNNVPIIKKYNISLGNANGDITKLASLYEDILPSEGNVSNNTFNTLKERMIIHHYIRSIFIKTGDGEELLINGGPNRTESEVTNLLSHVKLLEINPYHYNRLTDNIYKTLPSNFVMYRSCYPIKMGQFNSIECSKSSIGMNVRIYLLSKYDDETHVSTLPRHNSDVWRELDYYQFIREEVIKHNISPNFVSLHSYYMTKNTGINFSKFDKIKGQIEMRNYEIAKSNSDKRNNLYKKYIIEQMDANPKEIVTFDDLIREQLILPTTASRVITSLERTQVIIKRVERNILNSQYNHFMDSDKCLVMLSEAPTQHLLNWATRTYQVDNGPVKKMVQNGYHDDKVWQSVFFQLLLSMLIMFEKKIMFTEFSLKNNIFIKDLKHSDQGVGIWKYVFNGIEYFVPNYGYLLLIDSNYAEIATNADPLSKNYNPSGITFRIKSSLLSDTNANGEIYKLCLDRMIDVFNSNNFGREFTNYGGVAPTQAFLNSLDIIQTRLTIIKNAHFPAPAVPAVPPVPWTQLQHNNIIADMKNLPLEILKQNIFNMVHSRIGTPVKDQEITYVSNRFDLNTKYGSIVCRRISPTFNTFAVFLGQVAAPVGAGAVGGPRYLILTTDDPIHAYEDRASKRIIELVVDRASLLNYFGQPEHMYEPGKQYNVLETYLISLHN